MRVYVSVDMEGIAGIVHEDQTNPVDPRCAAEYARGRKLMTEEANAAVEGALAAGAGFVLLNDSQWTKWTSRCLDTQLAASTRHRLGDYSPGADRLRPE